MADANSGSSTRSPAKFGSLRLLVVAAVVLAVGGLAALTVSNTLRGRALDRPVVVSQADSVEDADQPVAEIKRAMKKGEEVRIPDFGTFKVAKRKARDGRNPATGATIKIPASKVPKFTPSKGLKELVN